MNVRFMRAVRTGPEHRGEAMTGAVAQLFAELLRNCHIHKAEGTAIRKYKCTQINSVTLAVLAHFRARDPIAATAFEVVISLDCLENRADLVDAWRCLVPQPAGNSFGECTTEHGWRPE